jgi:hypothetical protein
MWGLNISFENAEEDNVIIRIATLCGSFAPPLRTLRGILFFSREARKDFYAKLAKVLVGTSFCHYRNDW